MPRSELYRYSDTSSQISIVTLAADYRIYASAFLLPAKLHRVRADGEACASVHPQEPDAVQAVGVRDVAALRVHHLRHDPHQHAQPRHEVLPPARGVHQLPRRPERHLHRLLHPRVPPQARRLQIQGKITPKRLKIMKGLGFFF